MKVETIIKKAGGAQAVAKALKLHRQTVYQWKRVPAHHVLKMAKLSGLEPKQIRPDVF